MTVPLWMLLGFAAWTVLLLLSTVGVYRWSRILTGRVPNPDLPGLIRSKEKIGIGARCGLTRTASRTFLCLELLCLHFTSPASAAPL